MTAREDVKEAVAAQRRHDEVLGAVKEAIGEILARRSQQVIANHDFLLQHYIYRDDLTVLFAHVGLCLGCEGFENAIKLEPYADLGTVEELADALCAQIFADKPTEAAP